ncbi:MAG: hypothetical protein AAGI69_05300 [Cyanobacteria bacterium P01_H01_bin.21]
MSQEESNKDSIFPNEKNTPIEPSARRTGMGARSSDASDGAEPEAPGNKNTDIPGDPNQGTDAR